MIEIGRDDTVAALPVPTDISIALAGYRWERSDVGQSGGQVYRLHGKPGAPDLYLKYGQAGLADDITDEMVRLRWLGEHVPAPKVIHFTRTLDEAWLVMTAIAGKTAYQVMQERSDLRVPVVDAIATFLRRVHSIPASDCPFTSEHAYRLARARARIEAGLVDEDDFDAERQGWTAEQVWEAMHRLLPLAPDPVVTHGDYSLDNLLIQDGAVSGCIDTGRVGIADRYQDLAIALNCLEEFDVSLKERFLKHYGIVDPQRSKLQFHLMLDELF